MQINEIENQKASEKKINETKSYFFEKANKLLNNEQDQSGAKEILHKLPQGNFMKSFMPENWTTEAKRSNSLKNTNYHSSPKKKQINCLFLHLF
jgi:hypothetical protein